MLGKRVIKFESLKILCADKTGFRRLGHKSFSLLKSVAEIFSYSCMLSFKTSTQCSIESICDCACKNQACSRAKII